MTDNNHTQGDFRVEENAMGNVEVAANHHWGAQAQRSHLNFPIGVEAAIGGADAVIRALGILKSCAALANGELGQLPRDDLIVWTARKEVIDGRLDNEFPGDVPDRLGARRRT